MAVEHCVVIGGSHAGSHLVVNLRREGWQGDITLVSADSSLPYHRPPLSKEYLTGERNPDEILLRPQSAYDKLQVQVLLNSTVNSIDRERKRLTLSDGGALNYSKLALATGALVRKLTLPGTDLPGVLYLRDLADADAIKEQVRSGGQAVIVGGGYIGLETAASLRKLGMQVTVLEALPRILQRVTAAQVSQFYSRVHAEEGVTIITDAGVTAIEGADRASAVVCTDGRRIAADLVVIGVGVIPASGLAVDAGLEVDNGIVVDQYGRTSDPDIVAAGDCTNHHNSIYGRRVRLESVQNATDQAKCAAKTLCGKLEDYHSLPWFWSDQYDLKLQIAGLSEGFDRVVIRGDIDTGRSFAAFYYSGARLLAVDAINRPKEYMLTRRALTAGQSPSGELLADESADIQQIFSDL